MTISGGHGSSGGLPHCQGHMSNISACGKSIVLYFIHIGALGGQSGQFGGGRACIATDGI